MQAKRRSPEVNDRDDKQMIGFLVQTDLGLEIIFPAPKMRWGHPSKDIVNKFLFEKVDFSNWECHRIKEWEGLTGKEILVEAIAKPSYELLAARNDQEAVARFSKDNVKLTLDALENLEFSRYCVKLPILQNCY